MVLFEWIARSCSLSNENSFAWLPFALFGLKNNNLWDSSDCFPHHRTKHGWLFMACVHYVVQAKLQLENPTFLVN